MSSRKGHNEIREETAPQKSKRVGTGIALENFSEGGSEESGNDRVENVGCQFVAGQRTAIAGSNYSCIFAIQLQNKKK